MPDLTILNSNVISFTECPLVSVEVGKEASFELKIQLRLKNETDANINVRVEYYVKSHQGDTLSWEDLPEIHAPPGEMSTTYVEIRRKSRTYIEEEKGVVVAEASCRISWAGSENNNDSRLTSCSFRVLASNSSLLVEKEDTDE